MEGRVAAIGNFDGIHLGHQAILAAAGQLAAELGTAPLALTFEPHPDVLLRRKKLPGLLTPLPEKARWLAHYGVPQVVVASFDEAFAALPPERFLDEILGQRLKLKGVVVGEDFTFGHRARGGVALLREWGASLGVAVRVIPPVLSGGDRISSSRIRKALVDGAFEEATAMLGHPYTVTGPVVSGRGRGRVLGYPTANVAWDPDQMMPPEAVYLAEATLLDNGEDGPARPALAVYSRRPTFAEEEASLEVYLLKYEGDLYGQHLRVALAHRLRGIVRFDGAEALKARIEQDFLAARRHFGL